MSFSIRIRRILVLAVSLLAMLLSSSAYIRAEGGINENEARVLAVARGSFEYNGEVYTARQSYVNQLIAKLSSEDMNLTSEQADTAIATIYSNVEKGVEEGYIVKVDSPEDDLNKDEKDTITELSPEQEKEGIKSIEELKQKEEEENNADNSEVIPQVHDNNDGDLTVDDGKGNVIISVDGVLKNTGYSISDSIIYFSLIGVLFLCVLICSVKVILIKNKE